MSGDKFCEECDALFHDHDDVLICDRCAEIYWSFWCEECNADPEEECAEDCPNAGKPIS